MRTVLISSVKNEGPWIIEWIAYHRSLGFSSILIYQNDSEDLTDLILQRAQDLGYIEACTTQPGGGPPQLRACRDAAASDLYRTSDWSMFLDADEYFVPKTVASVTGFLADRDAADAIAINWRNFGSGGAERWEPSLLMDRFRYCARSKHPSNRHFKSIHRPQAFGAFGVHRPWRADPTSRYVYPDGTQVPDAYQMGANPALDTHAPICHKHAQINHYSVKSQEEFARKLQRGDGYFSQRGYRTSKFVSFDTNHVQDDSIDRFHFQTREMWLNIMMDGKLADLYRQTCRRHFGRDSNGAVHSPFLPIAGSRQLPG